MPIRVLICGGRTYSDQERIAEVLAEVYASRGGIAHIIHGGSRGADTLAGYYAERNGIPVTVYPAKWKIHGTAAGPIRNQQMLDEGKPDLVIAFPGGVGTNNMMHLSRVMGVEVLVVH